MSTEPNSTRFEFNKRRSSGETDFRNFDFAGENYDREDFSCLDLRGANFRSCSLRYARFGPSENGQRKTLLDGADFRGADLSGAELKQSCLTGASLVDAALHSTNLCDSDLTGANLSGASVDTATRLQGAKTNGMIITRDALELLDSPPVTGGLSRAQLRVMRIQDDAATLRQKFGGFLGVIHAVGLVLFLGPYVAFAATRTFAGMLNDCGTSADCEPLGSQLIQYTWSSQSWYARCSLLVFLAYNVIRAVLFWKTKQLELEEEVRGMPTDFSFARDPWIRRAFRAYTTLFAIYIVAIAIHTVEFLGRSVPRWHQ